MIKITIFILGNDGVLAYVVRDRNNPSRQFLVPASTLESGQFSL